MIVSFIRIGVGVAVKPMQCTNLLEFPAVLIAAVVLMLPDDSYAERIGYRFQGDLIQFGPPGNYSLFGINVPKNSPVSGTFSYDTTTPGVFTEPGAKRFQQLISGGYSLDINNGAIQLVASDYIVTVADDFVRQPENVDFFSVDYCLCFDPAPTSILVNGSPWSGPGAAIKLELSWPEATFEDLDEPMLTATRPLTPNPGVSAFVGSSTLSPNVLPRLFTLSSISAIVPPPGDSNRDGKINANDYTEWKKAFNQAGEPFSFADLNNDGNVDAADYVIWRKQAVLAGSGAGVLPATVPEPSALGLWLLALLLVASRRWKPIKQ